MSAEPATLRTADGETLVAEWSDAAPGRRRAVAALCHSHPQFGGTPRDAVTGTLFALLPPAGVAAVRFAFRGVDGSTGTYGGGEAERLDARAAVDEAVRRAPGVPVLLAGYSFGARVALRTDAPAVDAWIAVAPALGPADADGAAGRDPRPKLVVLAERDRVADPVAARDAVAGWAATEVVVAPGADHFFFGRTQALRDAVLAFVDGVAPAPG